MDPSYALTGQDISSTFIDASNWAYEYLEDIFKGLLALMCIFGVIAYWLRALN
jgi:hypothetical protein